jgi:hypothetical protein
MPLDSVCEPVAALPKELNEDLTAGWPSVIPDATRPDVERFPYPVAALIRTQRVKCHRRAIIRAGFSSHDWTKFRFAR